MCPSLLIRHNGLSKGVMLTHQNLVANLSSTFFGVTPDMIGKVTVLGQIPFFHIYGITGICCATLRNKGKVVVMGRFELRTFLNALISHEVTHAPIVPPIILNLVKNPIVDKFYLTKLRPQAIMTAAAPLAPEVPNAFENKFPGVQVQEVAPAELEAILLCHPSVEDVAVVPLPDDKEAGEIPATSVVIAAGAKESEEEIINYVASNVAQYKKVSGALCGHSTKITLREGHEKACQRKHDRKIKASKLHCLN
ncbi:hypothetical protein ACFX15_020907 [Malus domestica]